MKAKELNIMTTLDYLEKIDDTLANWEDYFHGQEGTDVTEARANLGKVREQLLIHSIIVPKGTLCDVCGSDDIIEAPSIGRNCNTCNPI